MSHVEVSYFAVLRDHATKSHEILEFEAGETARQLYSRLQKMYGFPVTTEQLRVAINDDFTSLDKVLDSGDHVVFIPPVAGG